MRNSFQLSDFPGARFELETSMWTGRSKLFMNGNLLEQANEKGKPFLIPADKGQFVKAFPKASFPDTVPVLEINGTVNYVTEKLNWYQYLIAAIPMVLVLIGGAIGGVIGIISTMFNLSIFRQDDTELNKYLKVSGVVLGAFLLHFIIVYYVMQLFS